MEANVDYEGGLKRERRSVWALRACEGAVACDMERKQQERYDEQLEEQRSPHCARMMVHVLTVTLTR